MNGLVCFHDDCRRPIGRGEMDKRVEWHQLGGQIRIFGQGAPDGPLAAADGPLVKVAHGKCYFADLKRRTRGLPSLADPPAQAGEPR